MLSIQEYLIRYDFLIITEYSGQAPRAQLYNREVPGSNPGAA
jgi:hypothetical protein